MTVVGVDLSGVIAATTTVRFGVITLGDGCDYMVARAGFGTRGCAMYAAIDEYRAAETFAARVACVRSLFTLALEPFYSSDRITQLLDNEVFGGDHLPRLIDIVMGNDAPGPQVLAG